MAEIARQVGVGTTGVAMAIKGMEAKTKLNEMNNVPIFAMNSPTDCWIKRLATSPMRSTHGGPG